MSHISHLTKRASVYYARMDVPTDLVPILKTQTRKISLKTKDEAEAKRRLWPVIAEWQREFDDLRGRRTLLAADREHVVWDHYTSTLERDDVERSQMPGGAEIEAARAAVYQRVERGEINGIDPLTLLDATLKLQVAQGASGFFARARKVKIEHMRMHLAKGETALIADAVDEYLRENGLHVDRSTVDWISVARLMMRAEIEALQRAEERDHGDFTGQPKDPIVKAPTLKRRGQAEAAILGESIFETLAVFKRENPRNVSASRMNESCRDIGIFIETIGPSFPIDTARNEADAFLRVREDLAWHLK